MSQNNRKKEKVSLNQGLCNAKRVQKLTAYAIAYPSKVLVPRPSSSRITKESCVAFRRTDAVSVHSTKKVPTTIFTLLKDVITTKKIL